MDVFAIVRSVAAVEEPLSAGVAASTVRPSEWQCLGCRWRIGRASSGLANGGRDCEFPRAWPGVATALPPVRKGRKCCMADRQLDSHAGARRVGDLRRAFSRDRWLARGFDSYDGYLVFGASGRMFGSDEPVWDGGLVARGR